MTRTVRDLAARREAPLKVVLSCYRLVKACQLYDDNNATVRGLVPEVAAATRQVCESFAVDSVRIAFANDVAFVNRRLLRAPRESYAIALQFGEMLGAAGLNELVLERGVSDQSAHRFARLLAEAQRGPAAALALKSAELPGVHLRLSPPPEDIDEQKKSALARVLEAYASSVLIVGSFFDACASGTPRGASELKRIAQKLVALAEREPELLLAAATAPLADASPARRAVSSAVLAIAMVNDLRRDRTLATTVALAALSCDVGPLCSDAAASRELQAATAVVKLVGLGGFGPVAAARTAIAYDTLHPTRAGEEPLLLAEVLRLVRRFNQLRAPNERDRGLRLNQAMEALQREVSAEPQKSLLRLLVSALGLVPPGTVVELTSGEVAVVVGVPASSLDFTRPTVRLLTDEKHVPLSEPSEVDLARPGRGQPERAIKRPLIAGGAAMT